MAKLIKCKQWESCGCDEPLMVQVSEEEVQPKNGTDFTLEELHGYIGGYIEIVPLTKNRIMIVDEEGKLKGLPLNPLATEIYDKESFCCIDTICGNALICKRGEVR